MFFGWIVIVFTVLTIWQTGYQLYHGAGWLSRSVFIDVVGLITNLLVYDKLGERIIAPQVLAESPNQSSEPAPSSVTPPAMQESRPR
jgi:general stress protein CsbA